jgi:hypothetical protein
MYLSIKKAGQQASRLSWHRNDTSRCLWPFNEGLPRDVDRSCIGILTRCLQAGIHHQTAARATAGRGCYLSERAAGHNVMLFHILLSFIKPRNSRLELLLAGLAKTSKWTAKNIHVFR